MDGDVDGRSSPGIAWTTSVEVKCCSCCLSIYQPTNWHAQLPNNATLSRPCLVLVRLASMQCARPSRQQKPNSVSVGGPPWPMHKDTGLAREAIWSSLFCVAAIFARRVTAARAGQEGEVRRPALVVTKHAHACVRRTRMRRHDAGRSGPVGRGRRSHRIVLSSTTQELQQVVSQDNLLAGIPRPSSKWPVAEAKAVLTLSIG